MGPSPKRRHIFPTNSPGAEGSAGLRGVEESRRTQDIPLNQKDRKIGRDGSASQGDEALQRRGGESLLLVDDVPQLFLPQRSLLLGRDRPEVKAMRQEEIEEDMTAPSAPNTPAAPFCSQSQSPTPGAMALARELLKPK